MKGIAYLIPADETSPVVATELKARPQYEFLSQSVGGYIELVPEFDTYLHQRCTVWCNENGKLERMPINTRATMAWNAALGGRLIPEGQPPLDVLVGDILVIAGDDEILNDTDDEE
jgi:Domain of unknown function (DUF3846)